MRSAAGATLRSGQTAVNLTLVLKDIEVPPDKIFGVVIAEDFCLVMRAATVLPKLRGFGNVKGN
jgi:hypothetical protein